LKKRCDNPQRDAKSVHCKGSSDDGDEHILEIADVDHDRHEDVGKLIGLIRVLKEGIVEHIKAFSGLLLPTEHLDDLLSPDHFFDIAVDSTQSLLLPDKVPAALTDNDPAHGQHSDHAEHHQHRQ